MKNLLHSFKKTPFLHASLMLSLRLLTTLAIALILFAAGIAFAAEPAAVVSSLDDPTVYLRIIFDAVEKKNWGALAAAVLVLFVAVFRAFGKKLHDFLPDDSFADKPLIFLYDTKLGGWVLNTCTAMAGGFGTALLAGKAIDFELVRTVLSVSLSAAGIWGAVKDAMEHYGKAKLPSAGNAVAAGVAAAVDPGKQLNS